MASALGGFYDAGESFFGAIGGNHPVGRFLIGAGLTVLVMEAIRPDFAYHANGGRRMWNYLSNAEFNAFSDDGGSGDTSIPFWLPPLAVGTVAATFI